MTIQFESWSAFIAMGGYGFYVWAALFVTFAALGLLALEVVWRRSRLSTEVSAHMARAARVMAAREARGKNKSSASTAERNEFKAMKESENHEPKT